MVRLIVALASALVLASAWAQVPKPLPIHVVAEQYLKLGLALGEHDRNYVDAYYGPPAWREEMRKAGLRLVDIGAQAIGLLARLDEPSAEERKDERVVLRYEYLRRQLLSLAAHAAALQGRKRKFDEESRMLFNATAPTIPDAQYEEALKDLDRLLPGPGTLAERYEAFRKAFEVPAERVSKVFDAALAECRRRTLLHARLPSEERVSVEYVKGKPWTAYQWYQGNFRSLIQVNDEQPMSIAQMIGLACHETYPGHHVYYVLLEKHLVRDRGWVEFSLYPLFSPQSLLSEGAAEYGIELAFPGDERVRFWREVLFPLAGLNPARAEQYHKVLGGFRKFNHSHVQAARRYLDGEASREATVDWLVRMTLMNRPGAERRVRFFEIYRSYVMNYSVGRDLVKRHVDERAGADAPAERRWQAFLGLLASPRLLLDVK